LNSFTSEYPNLESDLTFLSFTAFTVFPTIVATIGIGISLQMQYMGLWRRKATDSFNKNMTNDEKTAVKEVFEENRKALGKMTNHEILIGVIFILAVFLFCTRSPGIFTGWGDLIEKKKGFVKDSVVVVFVILLLFIIPNRWDCFQFCTKGELYGKNGTYFFKCYFFQAKYHRNPASP
jgi:sodium-dependent dicarboxylate transporter 2/3/5